MDPLTDAQLDEYLASGQWEGKAGAFGYQDRLGWVHIVEGSESNVVGLPMELLAEMLNEIAQAELGAAEQPSMTDNCANSSCCFASKTRKLKKHAT